MNMKLLRGAALAAALAPAVAAQAVEYKAVDGASSRVVFTYTQMGVAMDGSFGKFAAQINFDPARPEAARAVLEIQLASIDAGSPEANEEVKGKAWFNAAAHPLARFESTAVKALGGNRYQLAGKLSIKGRTREITAPLTYSPQGKVGVFDGAFTLRRADFAIGEGQWADFGVVANDIQVKFHITSPAAR